MKYRLFDLLFPPRCVLCRKVLNREETDLCRGCRADAPDFSASKIHFPFVARWTALWYYKDNVRRSLLRYKFYNRRSYAGTYGRLLGMKLLKVMPEFDILTWVPIGKRRLQKRGYDQVELIAEAIAAELDIRAARTLRKIRNTPPQSGIRSAAARRANVLGAYQAEDPEAFAGKRVLLLDDIITTGATASECARTLLIAGAKEVYVAAVATASQDKKK